MFMSRTVTIDIESNANYLLLRLLLIYSFECIQRRQSAAIWVGYRLSLSPFAIGLLYAIVMFIR